MDITIRLMTIEDYDAVFALWQGVAATRRALNPVDDSREGIDRYLRRNPTSCFVACAGGEAIVGAILSGHDGRRGLIHHLCVHPSCRRQGLARALVARAEEALRQEGLTKVFCLVFRDNDGADAFWESAGYSLRTNINYRNKSLNPAVPRGE